jgi:proline iminopeptidase
MPEATVNGAKLYYVEHGGGTPFIAVHGGLGFDHTYMRHGLRPLEDDVRMIYFDQRGNGRSQRVDPETITIPQLSDDVDGLRRELGLDRIGVVGHSYGGFVALQYAISYPDRVSHLICFDTSPGAFEPTADELAERPDPSWITADVQEAAKVLQGAWPTEQEAVRAMMPKIAPMYIKGDKQLLEKASAEMIFDVQTMARSMQALAGWSVADDLPKIEAPTLVMCGRYDIVTPPECAKRIATAVPGAELVWFENSGHFPELEEPDAFFGAVRDWLRRHA